MRIVKLGSKELELLGECPLPLQPLPPTTFAIPPARNATEPLVFSDLTRGKVFVSTLPDISKHACAAQILGLEEQVRHRAPEARLVHVSADAPHFWDEVDHFHRDLTASGYSLFGADEESARAFGQLFGVAVKGNRRIAHGLFALQDGIVVAAEIPYQQLGIPSIGRFMHTAMSRCGDSSCVLPH